MIQPFSICAMAPFSNSSVVIYTSSTSTPFSERIPFLDTQYTRFTSLANIQRRVSTLWDPRNQSTEDLSAQGSITVGTYFVSFSLKYA